MFVFIGDSKGQKYFTMNKFHMKISDGEFFLNYGIFLEVPNNNITNTNTNSNEVINNDK